MRRALAFALSLFALFSCKRSQPDAVKADEHAPSLTKHVEHHVLHRDDPRVAQIATDGDGICARREDGRVSCWLQYGVDVDFTQTMKPREIEVRDVVQLAGGWEHFCALHEDGTVTCWGSDKDGQIDGRGEFQEWATPRKVEGVSDAIEISVGGSHSCARLVDASVWCWGTGYEGQLGDGALLDARRHPPRAVKGLPVPTKQIAAAGWQSCALGDDGLVRCWGWDFTGSVPAGSMSAPRGIATPKAISGLTDARAIWAHKDFDCARLGDGSIRCWGAIMLGEPMHPAQTSTKPDFFHAFDGAKDLALKGWHACRVENDGRMQCLGDDSDGQLGDGTTKTSLTPVRVKGLTHVLAAAVTASVSCALTEERKVFCWGGDTLTGVGDGVGKRRLEPTPIEL